MNSVRLLNLETDQKASEIVSHAIAVGGGARSGTTILGNLLHTLHKVEYSMEPSMINALLPMLDHIDKDSWCFLYHTYLYEEFLLGNLAGRTINMNQYDDSSIYKVKDKSEIDLRLSKSWRRTELIKRSKEYHIAYKIPNLVFYAKTLLQYYPNTRYVVITRNATDVINSLMAKGWFCTATNGKPISVWPYRVHSSGMQIPAMVRKEDEEQWSEWNEIDRCAYYYIRVQEEINMVEAKISLTYRDLISQPRRTFGKVIDKLGLKATDMTWQLLESVKKREVERDKKIIDRVSQELRYKLITVDRQV